MAGVGRVQMQRSIEGGMSWSWHAELGIGTGILMKAPRVMLIRLCLAPVPTTLLKYECHPLDLK